MKNKGFTFLQEGASSSLFFMGIWMGNWISVKDRLPEQDVKVITYSETFGLNFGHLGIDKVWFVSGYYAKNVTHWQPLPEPPNEDAI